MHLVATCSRSASSSPQRRKETARSVVRKVVDELERKLANALEQAVRGASTAPRASRRPRLPDIDWDRTDPRQPDELPCASAAPSSPRSSSATAASRSSLRDIVLCVDQSGSMATSVVYSSIFGAVMASIRAVTHAHGRLRHRGRRPDRRARTTRSTCSSARSSAAAPTSTARSPTASSSSRGPAQTILVLITDLYEGGNAEEMLARVRTHEGERRASRLPPRAQRPGRAHVRRAQRRRRSPPSASRRSPARRTLFPEMIAAALAKRDVGNWASERGIVGAR